MSVKQKEKGVFKGREMTWIEDDKYDKLRL